MRRGLQASVAVAALAAGLAVAGGLRAAPRVAPAALIAAAKAAPVRAIDYDEDRCDGRTVGAWLQALTAAEARRTTWTAGRCQLVGPGIDAGSDWCAQAEITLNRPISRTDRPMIEIFFDAPVGGRPGPAYAFRAVMEAADGSGVIRFRREFEDVWTSRFPAPAGAIVDCPED